MSRGRFNQGRTGNRRSGGGGSSDVTGLTDTNITSPSNNEVLKYDSATSTWVNAADADTAYSLTAATGSTLGGIKVGNNLSIASGVLSSTDTNTTYSNATTSTSGLMSNSDKSKLDGCDASANNYSHPTSAGNKHIPSGGSSGQVLEYSSSGTAVWATPAGGGGGASDINGLSNGYSNVATESLGLGNGALSSEVPAGQNRNVAVGEDALTNNTTGSSNVAVGADALRSVTTSYRNVAVGHNALYTISGSSGNTAVGYDTLRYTTANSNVAVGYMAMRLNTSGYENLGIGLMSLVSNTTGHHNVGVGWLALQNNTNADYNTGVGPLALSSTTTGQYSVGIGYNAQHSSSTSSYQCTLGGSLINNLRCNDTTISSLSDQRDKAEITNLPDSAGLDFINALRPVTFYWDRREWYDDDNSDGSKIKRDYRSWKSNSGQRMGFIAQEVLEATQPHQFMKDSQVVTTENEDKLEFAPAHLITPLVKAVQQLTDRVAELEARLGE
jgi:hypothetical protein